MKTSVLIAAYRADATISRAIASVLAQTHGNWELVVVEDGSHDDTEAIVRATASVESHSVRYANSGVNQGVAAARNRLLQLATGDAIAFLDADDWWSPDHLERGLRRLAAGADLVATGVQAFDLATQDQIGEFLPHQRLVVDPVGALFDESVIVTSSCVLLTRAIAIRTGGFDPEFRVGEDRDYWLRAALAGARFAIEPALTCHYAKHPQSTMSRTELVTAQAVRFYEKHFALAAIPPARRRHHLARSLINEGRLLRAAHARASVRQLWRAWRLTPFDPVAAIHLVFSGSRAAFRS